MARPKKRNLLDALRDPDPVVVEQVKKTRPAKPRARTKVKDAPKKAAKKPAKKAPPKKRTWPDGWVLGSARCLGVTAKGTQCNRRAKPPKKACGAHTGHTMKRVVAVLAQQAKDAQPDPKVAIPTDTPSTSEGEVAEKHRLAEAPDERRCNKMLYVSTSRERRCSRWTVAIDDDAYDDYCVSHSKNPRAKEAMKRAGEKGAAGLESRNDYNSAAKRPMFNGELKTQDDVASSRLLLLRKLETGAMSAAVAGTVDGVLKNVSLHIERYGTHQGAEGGAGVLRLLPGTQLVEMETELDYVLTKQDLEKIEAGLAADEKAGKPTPAEFDEIILRYLGKQTRKRDRSRLYEE